MDQDATGTAGAKRVFDELGEPDESSAQQPKRIHAEDRLLLDILEDVTDPGDRGSAAPGDLATVMRSFEEEIAALSSSPRPEQPEFQEQGVQICEGPGQSDLGFLLEASDDDLGLPPTLSNEGELVGDGDFGEGGGNRELEALGNLWAFDDEDRSCYAGLIVGDLAGADGVADADDGGAFDGVLFSYADESASGSSEFVDLSWRPESLPAV